MCRIAAYVGPATDLHNFLSEPAHSMYCQSWAARELLTTTVNADGYGVAWQDPGGKPAVYRNTLPIWADTNLDALQRSLSSRIWIANIRSATAGLGTHVLNTQPYVDDKLLFVHNGFIDRFAHTLRRRLRNALDEDIEAEIDGNTDSEYIFALLRQYWRAGEESLDIALHTAMTALLGWCETSNTQAQVNVIVTAGNALHGVRTAVAGACPSLYFHPGHPRHRGGQLLASEAFDNDAGWQVVPPQHRIRLEPGKPPCLTAL